MRPRLLSGVVLGAIVVGSIACAGKVHAAPAHNAVTLWHERTQPVLATWTGRGNVAQAYTGSLVQIAVYDAVVAIRGGYRPFYAAIGAPDGRTWTPRSRRRPIASRALAWTSPRPLAPRSTASTPPPSRPFPTVRRRTTA